MAKTQDDWFLRGGERPDPAEENSDDVVRSDDFLVTCQNCGQSWPTEVGEICPMCGASLTGGASTAEYCGADGDGADCAAEDTLRSFNVTVVREKTVEQTHVMTVAARDEDEAIEVAQKILDSADFDNWDWEWRDDEDTEEYGEPSVADAEETF